MAEQDPLAQYNQHWDMISSASIPSRQAVCNIHALPSQPTSALGRLVVRPLFRGTFLLQIVRQRALKIKHGGELGTPPSRALHGTLSLLLAGFARVGIGCIKGRVELVRGNRNVGAAVRSGGLEGVICSREGVIAARLADVVGRACFAGSKSCQSEFGREPPPPLRGIWKFVDGRWRREVEVSLFGWGPLERSEAGVGWMSWVARSAFGEAELWRYDALLQFAISCLKIVSRRPSLTGRGRLCSFGR